MNSKVSEITKLDLKEHTNQKGKTFNIDLSDIDVVEIPVFFRKKEIKSPGHFHKGESKSRDPEILFVLKGKIKITFEDLSGESISLIFVSGEGYKCPSWIYQSYEVLEDCIFVEPRIDKYEENQDTFDRKEFEHIKQNIIK